MKQIKYWLFISTLSFALSNEGEGYRLIGNSTQNYYMDIENSRVKNKELPEHLK